MAVSGYAWLGPDEDYQRVAKQLHASDPRLYDKARLPNRKSTDNWSPKAAVLRLNKDGNFSKPVEYTTASEFKAYLQQDVTRSSPCLVYIIEGLSPDFISVIGPHFNLNPAIFLEQSQVSDVCTSMTVEDQECSPLASSWATRSFDTLKFDELVQLKEEANVGGDLESDLSCIRTGRDVAVTRIRGNSSPIGVARRCCTIWSRRRTWEPGTDYIVFCDPPIKKVCSESSGRIFDVLPLPQRFYYLDFIPLEEQMKAAKSRPRTSFLDDLCFYLEKHAHLLGDNAVRAPEVFVKKIVACHCQRLFAFTQSELTRQQSLDNFHEGIVESQWDDMQTWERRLGQLCRNMEINMLQMRIPLVNPDTSRDMNWTDSGVDFQYIYMRLREQRHRAERLSSASTGLAQIVGNRQSLREARSVTVLSYMGGAFLPVACMAGIFSMAERYQPWGDRFWVFAVTSVSLVLVFFSILGGSQYLNRGLQTLGMKARKWTPATRPAVIEGREVETAADPGSEYVEMQTIVITQKKVDVSPA